MSKSYAAPLATLFGIFMLCMPNAASAASLDVGEATLFNDERTLSTHLARIDATRVIAVYATGESGSGAAVIGTVDGDGISFGTPSIFHNAPASLIRVAMLDDTRAVITYKDSDTDYGTALVATISGDSLTFGTPVEYEDIGIEDLASMQTIAVLDENHVVIAYQQFDPLDRFDPKTGYVIVGEVDGTDIAFGTPVEYGYNAAFQGIAALDASRFAVSYKISGTGYAHIGTVDGTDIDLGSAYTFGINISQTVMTAPDSSHIIIAYQEGGGDSNIVAAVAGSVVGSDITFGAPVTVVDGIAHGFAFAGVDDTYALLAYHKSASSAGAGVALLALDGTGLTVSDSAWWYENGSNTNAVVALNATDFVVMTSHSEDDRGYYALGTIVRPDESSSSSSSSSQQPSQGGGGGKRGGPGRGGTAPGWDQSRILQPLRPAASVRETMSRDMKTRTCDRVMKWFKDDAKMLGRVNERLQGRFGFTCR